ncbi:MAG: hypothetical protein AAAC47_01995 [Pararhizobium sp.]
MIPREKWHRSLTDDVVVGAAKRRMLSLDNPGFCLSCGLEHDGVDPDARRQTCEACGERQVYGAEELVLSL